MKGTLNTLKAFQKLVPMEDADQWLVARAPDLSVELSPRALVWALAPALTLALGLSPVSVGRLRSGPRTMAGWEVQKAAPRRGKPSA